jgi:retron-type reverse transcriptase
LANMFLHVAFDKWMELHHPRKPFERYADDVLIPYKLDRIIFFNL